MQPDLKLLFDQNLARKLAGQLQDLFPGSKHVAGLKLGGIGDELIWEYARQNDFAIISKDSDFHHMSFLYGAPPKTIWLRCGNRSTLEIEQIVRSNTVKITTFLEEMDESFLVVS